MTKNTIPRPLTRREFEIVLWLVLNAKPERIIDRLLPKLTSLKVVGGCKCLLSQY
jgi:hypothetical protein